MRRLPLVNLGGDDDELVRWSMATARELLADLRQRLAHVEAVGRRAGEVAALLPAHDRRLLTAAAYLHDVGYAPPLRVTGLHPLDGACWLQDHGVARRVCNLVAHHSGARFEAAERGLAVELEEFDLETGPVMDGLIYADMTTGPSGAYVTFDERIDDILTRYPTSDPVSRAIRQARPDLQEAVERTLRLLAAGAHPM
jgi:HD superfamily phosphodiesterase